MVADTPLAQAIAKIDSANSADPNLEFCPVQQAEVPKELLYSLRMSQCLADFCPQASEHLQIAARAQHIERWKSPRTDYPDGKKGYKQWRSQLSLMHANRTAELMAACGYNNDDCERVKFLVQKRQLRRDPETQTLEDVICLVFLKYYFQPFAEKHPKDKVIDILRKTWNKMSEKGQAAALLLPLDEKYGHLVAEAVG